MQRARRMMLVLGGAFALLWLAHCGENRAERGAVAGQETATPENAKEMSETEAQREAETNAGEDRQEQKAMDEAARLEKQRQEKQK